MKARDRCQRILSNRLAFQKDHPDAIWRASPGGKQTSCYPEATIHVTHGETQTKRVASEKEGRKLDSK